MIDERKQKMVPYCYGLPTSLEMEWGEWYDAFGEGEYRYSPHTSIIHLTSNSQAGSGYVVHEKR
jgi:hypothetical protein